MTVLEVKPLSLSFVMQPAPAYIAGERYEGPRRGERTPTKGKLQPGTGGTAGPGVTDALTQGPAPEGPDEYGRVPVVDVGDADPGYSAAEAEPQPSEFDLGSRLDGQRYQARDQQVKASAVAALSRSLRGPNWTQVRADTTAIEGHLALDADWQTALQQVSQLLGVGKAVPQIDTDVPGFSGLSFKWREGGLTYRVSILEHGPDWNNGYELVFDQFEVNKDLLPKPVSDQPEAEVKDKKASPPKKGGKAGADAGDEGEGEEDEGGDEEDDYLGTDDEDSEEPDEEDEEA